MHYQIQLNPSYHSQLKQGDIIQRVNSVYASASFGFRDFLFVEGTVRNDTFSMLPKPNISVNTFSTSGRLCFHQNTSINHG